MLSYLDDTFPPFIIVTSLPALTNASFVLRQCGDLRSRLPIPRVAIIDFHDLHMPTPTYHVDTTQPVDLTTLTQWIHTLTESPK